MDLRDEMSPEIAGRDEIESTTGAGDPNLVETIDDVVRSVQENVKDEEALVDELNQIRDEHVAGVPLTATLGRLERPRVLALVDGIVERLISNSGRLRRAFVRSLVRDGESVTAVARRFGVSHQRISAILKRSGA